MNEPPLGSRPRQARGIAARARVYSAAMQQFADKGVAEARIEDVVATAGVAWGTFYRYFPRKEDVLLEAAVVQFREQIVPLVEADLGDPRRSSRENALRLFIALLEPGELPPRLRGEILKQVVDHRERFTAMLGTDGQPLVQLVARIVRHGQQRGEVRTDVDPFTLAGTLLAGTALSTIYVYYGDFREFVVRGPAALDFPALVERFFGIIWRGLEPLQDAGRANFGVSPHPL
ncbi:MAG TPA: TetR/AcrR family transcriptional regulator [Solirubrobacteraceae bacterium]|nr:TetR/AcrR family transcriptional regulator [Solirubrobacteraceae bacterium]